MSDHATDPELAAVVVPPESPARCCLCGAPFLTVGAVLVTSHRGVRHVAHADCAELELDARRNGRRPRIRSFVVGIDDEKESRS